MMALQVKSGEHKSLGFRGYMNVLHKMSWQSIKLLLRYFSLDRPDCHPLSQAASMAKNVNDNIS